MANKRGRPRTSKTATESKREYDRLRMRLKSQYTKAGLDWNDYKERFSAKFLREELMKGLELHPKSPVVIEIKKNIGQAVRIAMRERAKFMENIAMKGSRIGVKNALEMYYKLDRSGDEIRINGKKYKHYVDENGVHYGLHNGTIKVLKAHREVINNNPNNIAPVKQTPDIDEDLTPIDDIDSDIFGDFDTIPDIEDYDEGDYEPDYEEWYEFDDEFEGVEYKGED